MAKYNVTYACGHSDTVELLGPGKARESKLEWFRRSADCPACYRAAKRAVETAATESVEQQLALPALDGSDKQIGWAAKIRAAKLAEVASRLEAKRIASTATVVPGLVDAVRDVAAVHGTGHEIVIGKMMAALTGETSAKWWIDRRDLSSADLILVAAKLAIRV